MGIRISDISVGQRRREDLGDLTGLAESLKKHGLIHPIVVDEDLNLIAGQRRLEAAKLIGWTEIEVVYKTEFTEKQKQMLELEENLHRKDLTEYEKSKKLAELKKVVEEIAKEENCLSDKQFTEERKGGRGKKIIGSYRDVEARTGIDASTFKVAEQHVQAVEKYPELINLPKKEAIQVAKKLDEMPQPAKEEKLEQLKQVNQQYKEDIETIDKIYKLKNRVRKAIYDTATMPTHEEALEAYMYEEKRSEYDYRLRLIDDAVRNLIQVREFVTRKAKNFQLIQGGKQLC